MNDYQFRGPSFQLTGFYSGDGSEPINRWFRRFDVEVLGYADQAGVVPPAKYIKALLILLKSTAADWVESHYQTSAIINKREPTEADVKILVDLLEERFPGTSVDTAPIPLSTELLNLGQHSDESLASYYQRTANLMSRFGAKDRPSSTSALSTFSQVDGFTLDSIIQAFVRGITDQAIRKKIYKNWQDDFSLRGVYNLAEQARRSKLEVAKRMQEESKDSELDQLRAILQRLPPSQVEAVRSALATNPGGSVITQPLQAPQQQQPRAQYEQQQPRRPLRDTPNTGNRRFNPRAEPKELPDASKSKNPYINGTLIWSIDKDGVLCIRCGEIGHTGKNCNHMPLPAWEQSHLKHLVFGDPPQVSFAAAGYGAYDGAVQPYSVPMSINSSSTPGILTPPSWSAGSASTKSVGVGFSGLRISEAANVKAVDVFYGESSGPNKRPHAEEPRSGTPPQPSWSPINKPQQPTVTAPGQSYFPFQASEPVNKKKGPKRVGKRAEPMPLVGQMNDSGAFDKPVSIRQVLMDNKVDMSFLDLMVWSPTACRELKRLCTRVTKKKGKKGKQPEQPLQPSFNPLFPLSGSQQQFPQFPQFPTQPLQSVPYPTSFTVPPMQAVNQPPAQQVPQPQQPAPVLQQPIHQPIQQSQPASNTGVTSINVSSLDAHNTDAHTRFLSTLVGMEKAFRIPCTIRHSSGQEITLEKHQTHADQGSEMNVISSAMATKLGLQFYDLASVGFQGLSMETADHNDTMLHYWVSLDVGVEGLWRTVRCFVGPDGRAGQSRLSLLLGLPWLYAVNAMIDIRGSRILVGDSNIGEKVRAITGPELVFHTDHNLLLYPKQALLLSEGNYKTTVEDASESSSEDEDEEESADDLSDVEVQGFR